MFRVTDVAVRRGRERAGSECAVRGCPEPASEQRPYSESRERREEAPAHCMGTGRAAMFTSAHPSLVQYDTDESRVNLQAAVVFDESELPKLVHEKVHARACRTHHLGERFLR